MDGHDETIRTTVNRKPKNCWYIFGTLLLGCLVLYSDNFVYIDNKKIIKKHVHNSFVIFFVNTYMM